MEIQTLQPRQNTPARGTLISCNGAKKVDREELFGVPTPRGTSTWFPLSHRTLVAEVESQLKSVGFTLTAESHALSHDGARYFGILSVTLPTREETDVGWVVGLRNSHDKTFPAGLVAGTKVLVCSNLAFVGEVRIARKHTRFAYRDLRHLTARAVGQLGEKFQRLDQRVTAYRNESMPDHTAHDVVIRAVDCRAITPTKVPDVLKEWREPSHAEFQPRNAWSLFNAFTEQYKDIDPTAAVQRSQALHGLFDHHCGIRFTPGLN